LTAGTHVLTVRFELVGQNKLEYLTFTRAR
jgi:hypothetical protein